MLARTHVAFGAFVSVFLVWLFEISDQLLFALVVCLFSIFPDIDQPSSWISNKVGFFSFVGGWFGHRKFFHSFFVPVGLVLLLYIGGAIILGFGVFVGYFSHLFLDALSRQGIMPFYPLTRFRLRGWIPVGGAVEKILFYFSLLGSLGLVFFV